MRDPPRLTGRARETDLLLCALEASRVVTVCGPPGVGKSALVREALATRTAPVTVLDDIDTAAAREAIDSMHDARFILTGPSPIGHADEAVVALEGLDAERGSALLGDLAGRTVEVSEGGPVVARWDGLPIALVLLGELARVMPLADVEARLDPRTLRDLVRKHLDRLPEEARAAVDALALLGTSFTLDDAEGLVGAGAPGVLARLLDRGIVTSPSPGVFRMLRVFRAIAARAPASVALFADYTFRRIELLGPRSGDLDVDVDARRLAVSWDEIPRPLLDAHARAAAVEVSLLVGAPREDLAAADATDAPFPLAIASAEAWRRIGHAGQARALADRALQIAATDLERGRALRARGGAERLAGEVARAEASLEEAVRLLARTPREDLLALALGELGFVLSARGRLVLACEHHLRAHTMHVKRGAARLAGIEASYLGVATHRLGRLAESLGWHDRALAAHRATRNARYEGAERMHMGYVLYEMGDLARAAEELLAARELHRKVMDASLEGMTEALLGRLATDRGDLADARAHLMNARLLLENVQNTRMLAMVDVFTGHLALSTGAPAQAATAYERALASTARDVGFEALTPAYLALALVRAGDPEGRAPGLMAAALEETRALENPALHRACEILASGVSGHAAPAPEADPASSDVRRARALVTSEAAGGAVAFEVEKDGLFVVTPDGTRVDFSRKKAVRRVLVALVAEHERRPGGALATDAIVAAGWPDERLIADAAVKRAYTAIWTLRQVLGDALLTRGEGYLIDPGVRVGRPR